MKTKPISQIKDRLTEALIICNITPKQLSDLTKIPKSSISQYMSGYAKPKQDRIYLISNALHINPTWLLGYDVNMRLDDDIEEVSSIIDVVKIPLYSSISCGTGLFVDDNIDDYIAVPNRFVKSNKNYFANYASGDSMIGKGIQNGDVLVFEQTQILDNGQIGAFCINDENAVCKTFRKLSNGIVLLESANSAYDPIEIDVMKDDCFRIIGRLVGSFKKF